MLKICVFSVYFEATTLHPYAPLTHRSGHGTLTPMASLFPKKAVGFLQFGFQVPNAFALGLCLRLGLYNVNTSEVMEVYTDDKVQK